MDSMKIGDEFLQKTKYARGKLSGSPLNWQTKPEIYKTYSDAPIFSLPKFSDLINTIHSRNFLEILKERRSIRNFTKSPLDVHQLAYLLWASTGISRDAGSFQFRTAPSAGALYPIETYLCINQTITSIQLDQHFPEIPPGIYHYNIFHHALEQIKEGDYRTEVSSCSARSANGCSSSGCVYLDCNISKIQVEI